MEEEQSFLGSLMSLTMASHHLAPDVQREFFLQDPLFSARADFLSEKTLACVVLLLRFLLPSPQSRQQLNPRRAASIASAVSEVTGTLLNSVDLLLSPASPAESAVEVVDCNGIRFLFSRNVARPPPFRCPSPDRGQVKPISAFPRFLAQFATRTFS
jgi:hypothetical protein